MYFPDAEGLGWQDLRQLLPVLLALPSDAFFGLAGTLDLGRALGYMALQQLFPSIFVVQEIVQELDHVVEDEFLVFHACEAELGLHGLDQKSTSLC
jgi:hypothetical protein